MLIAKIVDVKATDIAPIAAVKRCTVRNSVYPDGTGVSGFSPRISLTSDEFAESVMAKQDHRVGNTLRAIETLLISNDPEAFQRSFNRGRKEKLLYLYDFASNAQNHIDALTAETDLETEIVRRDTTGSTFTHHCTVPLGIDPEALEEIKPIITFLKNVKTLVDPHIASTQRAKLEPEHLAQLDMLTKTRKGARPAAVR